MYVARYSIKEWEEHRDPLGLYYCFEDYLIALLEHHEQIENEFPYMFQDIVYCLINIERDRGISYEEWFPEHNPNVFKRVRDEILIPKKYLAEKSSPMKYILKEMGIEPI